MCGVKSVLCDMEGEGSGGCVDGGTECGGAGKWVEVYGEEYIVR